MIDMVRGEPAVASDEPEQWLPDTVLLRELVELTTVPEVESGDVTITLFVEAAGNISRMQARRRLDSLVERGILVTPKGKRRDPATGRQVRVWRKKVQE